MIHLGDIAEVIVEEVDLPEYKGKRDVSFKTELALCNCYKCLNNDFDIC